jgi:hypothetical protein
VSHDPNTLAWRKSTFSGGGNDCVEMADAGAEGVAVRNSNHPDAGTLYLDRHPLADLFAAVKLGQLDDLV